MFGIPDLRSRTWRHVHLTLATLALALKVMIPAGFMAAPSSNTLPFAIVLCTGQGSAVVQPGEALPHAGDKGQAPAKSAHDSPCAFAGHGIGAPPPSLLEAARPDFVAYQTAGLLTASDLAPGRGLAAPPPPARGPPSFVI